MFNLDNCSQDVEPGTWESLGQVTEGAVVGETAPGGSQGQILSSGSEYPLSTGKPKKTNCQLTIGSASITRAA